MRPARLRYALAALLFVSCSPVGSHKERTLHIGYRAVAGSSDPNHLNSMYDLHLADLLYDQLYEFEYLARPYRLKPGSAAAMPAVSRDGRTYTIKLRPGMHYIDAPCFPEGKGREVVAHDFVMNLYRKADANSKSENWWLISGRIAGLDSLRKKYRGKPFNYDETIEDLKALDKYTIQFRLKKAFPQIMWILAMPGMAPYPKECADHYGDSFGDNPVGSGPFKLAEWEKGIRYTLVRNEKYREDYYPELGAPEDRELGRLEDSGKRIPFADKVVVHEFNQDRPYWKQFRSGKLAWAQVPKEFADKVFKVRSRDGNKYVWERDSNGKRILTEAYAKRFRYEPHRLLDFVYRGFNYEDPVVGGEKGRKLRQAILLTYDIGKANDLFYNGLNTVYSGVIPPRLSGFDPALENPYRGPDIERAGKLLAEAGYPGGRGLPEIQYCGRPNARSMEEAAHFIRGAKQIGVRIRYDALPFAELSGRLKRKQCQMMALSWGADWPDSQNFVQLFYGPNKSPGSNSTNYDNGEVNTLYEKALPMADGPARNAIYRRINQIIIEDVPFMGAMARIRDYLISGQAQNFKPEEMIHSHAKYVRLKSWTPRPNPRADGPARP